MIIECQACQARFRLDESKIKGKGARIRCRKCGESIIVMKSDISPPQKSSPVGKEHFDLRAVLQEPEKRPPLPPRDEVGTAFESILGRERKTEQAQSPAPEETAPPPLKQDEVDAAFDKILGGERETEQVPAPVAEEPALPEEEAQETFTQEPTAGQTLTPEEAAAGIESPLFREEEEQPAPVAEEPAPPEEEAQETFAQEPAGQTRTPDEAAAGIESPLFREEEEQPAPVAEEPAPPAGEERETLAQSPMEESPPRWDDIASDLDALLHGKQDQETFAQEPNEQTRTPDEDAAGIESPLFREEEEQPPPVAEEPAAPAGEERETLAQSPMEEPPPRWDDIASDLDALLHGKQDQETFAQEPTGQIRTPEEDAADIESPLLREEEEQPPPVAEEPAEPTLTRDEVDSAFESILGKERETGQETPLVAEEGALLQEAQDISSPLELGKEGDISPLQQTGETPVRSPEDLAGGEAHPPPLAEEGMDHPDQHATGFLDLDTALPDFLRRGEAAREPGKQFDISERLSDAPIGAEGEDVAPVFPAPDSPESLAHNLDPADSRAETIQDQLSDLFEGTSTEETSVPDSPPPEIPSPEPMEIERKPAIRPRPKAPSGKPSVALLALLFVVLAGGGAYLAFTETGQQTLRTLIPSMESLWLGGKESVKPYSIGNLIGYYETGDKAGRMFVIKGVATNQGRKKKSGIRIRAELLDGNHQTIAEKTVYGGNIITGLRSADQETIETAMSNRFGDKLSNVDVAPGKSVPFMLVFFNPPEGIEEYRLEALDGD